MRQSEKDKSSDCKQKPAKPEGHMHLLEKRHLCGENHSLKLALHCLVVRARALANDATIHI